MNAGELKRKLKKIGCYKHHEGKRHEMWYSPITGKQFPVSRHDGQEIATGTLKSKRTAGLNKARPSVNQKGVYTWQSICFRLYLQKRIMDSTP